MQQDFVDPVVITFPCTGPEKTWTLHESKLREYEETFDTVDVRRQIRLALQWIRDNPTNRKTARGMPRFLNNWFSKCVAQRQGLKSNAAKRQHTGTRYNTTSDPAPFEDVSEIG